MVEKFNNAGVLHSKQEYKKAILKREAESSTGLGMNIAIPHGKSMQLSVQLLSSVSNGTVSIGTV